MSLLRLFRKSSLYHLNLNVWCSKSLSSSPAVSAIKLLTAMQDGLRQACFPHPAHSTTCRRQRNHNSHPWPQGCDATGNLSHSQGGHPGWNKTAHCRVALCTQHSKVTARHLHIVVTLSTFHPASGMKDKSGACALKLRRSCTC